MHWDQASIFGVPVIEVSKVELMVVVMAHGMSLEALGMEVSRLEEEEQT